MPIEVVEDLINGSSAVQDGEGLKVTRVFHVKGLSGSTTGRTIAALSATGIPAYGDYHPDTSALRVVSKGYAPIDPTQGTVTVQYAPWRQELVKPQPGDPAQISIGATLVEKETNQDINGALVTLDWTDPDTGDPGKTEGAKIQVQVPQPVFSFVRSEDTDQDTLQDVVLLYVGKTNSVPWKGGAINTWLCTRIQAQSDDGGATFRVTYEFQYHEAGWDATVVYTDPETGEPVPDPVDGVGIKTVQIYDRIDFNGLSLD